MKGIETLVRHQYQEGPFPVPCSEMRWKGLRRSYPAGFKDKIKNCSLLRDEMKGIETVVSNSSTCEECGCSLLRDEMKGIETRASLWDKWRNDIGSLLRDEMKGIETTWLVIWRKFLRGRCSLLRDEMKGIETAFTISIQSPGSIIVPCSEMRWKGLRPI